MGGTAAFALLALWAAIAGPLPGDVTLRQVTLDLVSAEALAFLRVANHAGSWRVLLPATVVLVLALPAARVRWYVWTALMVLAPIVEGLAKTLIGRPRPEGASFGFPSGHATAAAAFVGAVLYLAATLPPRVRRPVQGLAVAVLALVGIARVALRAHWPSDVAGGVALGLALASGAALLGLAQGRTAVRPGGARAAPRHDTS